MILQALVQQYEALSRLGKIAPPGWAAVKTSYALCIGSDGQLEQVVCLKTEQQRGKKVVLAPQLLQLPAPVKRSSGISPNFLWDNSAYLLGVDAKGKPERAIDCFQAAAAHHHKLLDAVNTPAASALLRFFDTWKPQDATGNPALRDILEDVMAGANLVFRYQFSYLHEDPMIRQAWEQYHAAGGDGPRMTCLVTGQEGPVEAVHPAIKGVKDAQSSGAALVSFNAPAFCSYGKEQNLNAPVGQYAAFAYTTALNHMLADRQRVYQMGDTTVLFWAESGEDAYADLMGCCGFDQPSPYSEEDLWKAMQDLCSGETTEFDGDQLDPNMTFYILGLAPNAARLSVRFFLRNNFGKFLSNVQAHHKRMKIVRPSFDRFETIPLWKLLDETVNQNSRNKAPVPNLAGETLRAILNDAPYPAQLLNGVMLRIRAEHEITRGRAAILRAYYTKKPHKDVPEEVLTVSLNPDSTNVPYTLGRLFSVLEDIQFQAIGQANATIKDRYFNAASATPSHVFPTLVNLSQKHLQKIRKQNAGYAVVKDQLMTDLMGKLGETYPAHLSIPEQGAFQLGYYHQTQDRYTTKKNKEEI